MTKRTKPYVVVTKDRYGFSAIYRVPQDPSLDEESQSFDTYEGAAEDGVKWAKELGVQFLTQTLESCSA